jgi:succinoglycan biosynthesis protein ExoA
MDPWKGSRPELAVVVAVRNEREHLPRLLADLRRQTLPRSEWELAVVDGMSRDGTFEWARSACAGEPAWRVLRNPPGRAGAGRNRGVAATSAPFLLFLDGHCRLPSSHLLANVLAAFRAGHACLSRPQRLVPADRSALAWAIVAARSAAVGHLPGSAIRRSAPGIVDPKSAGCAYRRSLFLDVGGYDESFDAAEDVELNWRIRRTGVRAFHSAAFETRHVARASLPGLARQLFRYGVGRARLHRKWPGALDASVLPLGGLLLIVGGLCVAPRTAAALLFAALLFAGLVALRPAWRRGAPRAAVPWLFAAIVAIPLASAAGYAVGLRDVVRPRPQRTTAPVAAGPRRW